MTIRKPAPNLLDRILAFFGKERGVVPPPSTGEIYKKFGPYVDIMGKRESFWKALFSKRANCGEQ
jgi:hypothetical protein